MLAIPGTRDALFYVLGTRPVQLPATPDVEMPTLQGRKLQNKD